jgi:hypothetical protein
MSQEATSNNDPDGTSVAMSQAGWSFRQENGRLLHFVEYVASLATATDKTARVAARALYEVEEPEKYREALDKIEKRGAFRAFRDVHRALLFEMMICRGVDNFLSYITQLLALIFRTRPETLRSSETVRLDAVLKHSTMADLVHELAERRVNQLSYQGMRDLAAYVSDRLGFVMFVDADKLNNAFRIIESRNLIVHNRGIVNELYLSRVGSSPAPLGVPIPMDPNRVLDDLEFLEAAVRDIDARAAAKFGLPVEAKGAPPDVRSEPELPNTPLQPTSGGPAEAE